MRVEANAAMTLCSIVRGLTMKPMYQRLTGALSVLVLLAVSALLNAATNPAYAATAPGQKQRTFTSAQEGMEAIAAAIAGGDLATLRAILGPESDAILKSGDGIEDKESLARFD